MFSFPVESNVLLSNHSTFKIGGRADYFFIACSVGDIKRAISEANENQIPYFILGNGSNVLFSDAGFRGLVIKIEIKKLVINNNLIIAGAGETIGNLLSFCKNNKLSGLEFLSSIPATIGGAIWANVGSAKENISQFIQEITVLKGNNAIIQLNKEQANFQYRDSIFKHQPLIIIETAFQLKAEETSIIEKKMMAYAQKKNKEQDLKYPSAGSIFKNPEGASAWELIDKLGLRGYQMGGAKISEKHANFIVNTGKATASDVIMLISLIKQKVRDNLGVQLMEEIKYVGF